MCIVIVTIAINSHPYNTCNHFMSVCILTVTHPDVGMLSLPTVSLPSVNLIRCAHAGSHWVSPQHRS